MLMFRRGPRKSQPGLDASVTDTEPRKVPWRVISLAIVVIGAPALLFFVAALGDYQELNCVEWPQANQCEDAHGVMWKMGPVVLSSAILSLLLWRKGQLNA